ncbi:hypothetical protein EU537_05865 [Candidatus Thorarchaeota archaeon]|nr:MAG: hypothetical protein EU537_05865 [Candidatus Thorarchaeota archaeon]
MSNYERNNTMVACIIAVIVIGAIVVGALAWFGTAHWNWTGTNWQDTTEFTFEREPTTMPELTTVNISIDAGAVRVMFVEDNALLYRIDMEVPNNTIQQYGLPTVDYASGFITLDYPAAAVNVTLGSGSNYTMDLNVASGGCQVAINEYAHIGNVDITATTGGIELTLSDDAILYGDDVHFVAETTTGGIQMNVALPNSVGGRFTASTTIGGVDIVANGWSGVDGNIYETSDYNSASQTLTISATATMGGVQATLS